MGLYAVIDCDIGPYLTHYGGYPGYGSFMMLLPDRGFGLFAFASLTYAEVAKPAYEALIALQKAGYLEERTAAVAADLAGPYRAVAAIYRQGDIAAAGDVFAMNFLMDRDALGWARELASLKKQVGDCDTDAPLTATGALSGTFTWRCAHGRVTGSVLLAPTRPPRIQSIELTRKAP
jgi:hypothetical protein